MHYYVRVHSHKHLNQSTYGCIMSASLWSLQPSCELCESNDYVLSSLGIQCIRNRRCSKSTEWWPVLTHLSSPPAQSDTPSLDAQWTVRFHNQHSSRSPAKFPTVTEGRLTWGLSVIHIHFLSAEKLALQQIIEILKSWCQLNPGFLGVGAKQWYFFSSQSAAQAEVYSNLQPRTLLWANST